MKQDGESNSETGGKPNFASNGFFGFHLRDPQHLGEKDAGRPHPSSMLKTGSDVYDSEAPFSLLAVSG